ncbi:MULTISPECIES: hypothetical protein [unclassified Caballeronia]|uniref:hypothetical protein n=1 Tax=unclassified Caballeronia TaxID=2646786 RepID=UPI001F28814B|nr:MULTISPECIES: hypothetical protein [unclassified Caballeronia]MCE4547558.1 hypothetical protein [Caballeronia sp. PC1]MCE4575017.1 hypothetical protein [Caballeronia sp. CLC5]
MKTWLALFGAPSIVLGCLSVNYALVTPACRLGGHALLDGVSGASLVVCTAATLLAWQRWRETRRSSTSSAPARSTPPLPSPPLPSPPLPSPPLPSPPLPTPDMTGRPARAGFIAAVAAGVGALSVLSVIAITIPQWLLSAC